MPARTRALKKIIITFGVLLIAVVFVSLVNRDNAATYELSNDAAN